MSNYFIGVLIVISFFIYYRLIKLFLRKYKREFNDLHEIDQSSIKTAIVIGFIVAPIGVVCICVAYIILNIFQELE